MSLSTEILVKIAHENSLEHYQTMLDMRDIILYVVLIVLTLIRSAQSDE